MGKDGFVIQGIVQRCLSNSSLGMTDKTFFLSAVGLGACWAWRSAAAATFESMQLASPTDAAFESLVPFFGSVAAMIFLLAASQITPRVVSRPFIICLGVLLALISVVLVAADSSVYAFGLLRALRALSFFCATCFIVLWGSMMAAASGLAFQAHMAASLCFSGVLHTMVQLPTWGSASQVILLPLLPVVATVCLAAVLRMRPSLVFRSETTDSSLGSTIRILAGLIGLIFVVEVVRMSFTPANPIAIKTVGLVSQGCIAIVFGAVALWLLRVGRSYAMDAFLRLLLLVLIAGVVCLLAFGDAAYVGAMSLIGVGYWSLCFFAWTTGACIERDSHIISIQVFALVVGSTDGAVEGAQLLSLFLTRNAVPETLVVSAAILAIALGIVLLLREHGADASDGIQPALTASEWTHLRERAQAARRAQDEFLTLVGDAYGLTARENEVLLLLVRGRSLPYIKESLGIATGTAQAHTTHIYEKLGIHSKQELLDLVEELADRPDEPASRSAIDDIANKIPGDKGLV